MAFTALCAAVTKERLSFVCATPSALILRSDHIADVIASRRMAPGLVVRDGRFRALLTMRMKMRIPGLALKRSPGMTCTMGGHDD
jgi:hypothetical protein